jgi:hypothetical protein
LAIVVLGALLLLTSNVERLSEQVDQPPRISLSSCADERDVEQSGAIEQAIDAAGMFWPAGRLCRRRMRCPVQARLRQSSPRSPPDSTTIRSGVDRGAGGVGRRERPGHHLAVQRMATMPGVADVRVRQGMAGEPDRRRSRPYGVGLDARALVALAAAATVTSVVRLGLQSRYQEIEIMQLVGSPLAFIRGPLWPRDVPGRIRGDRSHHSSVD